MTSARAKQLLDESKMRAKALGISYSDMRITKEEENELVELVNRGASGCVYNAIISIANGKVFL